MDEIAPAVAIAATIALNLGLACAFGALTALRGFSESKAPWDARCAVALERTVLIGIAVALTASGAMLVITAASFADVPIAQAFAPALTMMSSSHYGRVWVAGSLALACAGIARSMQSSSVTPHARHAATVGLLALFAVSRSLMSHADVDGDFSVWIAVDTIHLIAMSVWVGEVIIGATIAHRPRAIRGRDHDAFSVYTRRLSRTASWALVVVVVTGSLNALRALDAPADLIDTHYGNLLSIKLALVSYAIALGGFNRFFVMPALDRRGSVWSAVLRIEAAVLLMALAVAADLSATPLR